MGPISSGGNDDCKKLGVLNCITGLNIGGAEHMMVRYVRHLINGPFDFSVLSLMTPGPLQRDLLALQVPVVSLAMARALPSLRAVNGLKQVFARMQPSLVHGWMYHGNIAATVGALMGSKPPVIWSVHHSVEDIRNENAMTQALIRLSAVMSKSVAAIVYCSKASADQHERLGYDAEKRVIIRNGVDANAFRPWSHARAKLKAMLGIGTERLVIGNVARAHPMKDHRTLVRAGHILVRQGLDIQLLFVGADHDSGAVREEAAALGIVDRVCILGPQQDVTEIVAGLDIYASSSAWGETFSLAILEAMASGVPSVTTDVGDCAELIGDADLIAPPRNAAALAAVLARLCALSYEERARRGLRARDRVVGNYSLESYVRSHMRLYEQVLAGAQRIQACLFAVIGVWWMQLALAI
ncbi:glycosyltransferase [Rhodoligotrophos ferricapiens]|uniref:glycosyltransferase n=1 Tax=Rhodoligotrophos ferricapiens TaxID=3069264 RepID=UPI00315C6801